MVNLLVIVVGALVGFVGSRAVRRPRAGAQAASVARSVSGSLGARRGLSGPELQRACFSEMVRHVRVTRQGQTHAPTSFVLGLHPADLAVVDEGRQWFTSGLVEALRQAAQENGWVLDGPISIEYRVDPGRRPGVPSAVVAIPAIIEPPAVPARPEPAPSRRSEAPPAAVGLLAIRRADSGATVVLGDETLTIGRSPGRSISIDDSRVSRLHARIEARKGGWALVDEGSANGTRVAGEMLPSGRPCPLRVGDVISIGPEDLQVVEVAGHAAPAGTRALADSDRTRISSEFLPPNRNPQR